MIDNTGIESETANQVNSSRWRPLNQALNGDPVRIMPGQTVVTQMPSFASSARIESDSPVSANLLAQYGTRCGTPILPPIDEMFTMRPPAAAPHVRHGREHRVQRRPEVHGHRFFEIRHVHVVERADLHHAGVVDQHVDASRRAR